MGRNSIHIRKEQIEILKSDLFRFKPIQTDEEMADFLFGKITRTQRVNHSLEFVSWHVFGFRRSKVDKDIIQKSLLFLESVEELLQEKSDFFVNPFAILLRILRNIVQCFFVYRV